MSSPSSPTLLFDVSSRRAECCVAWMTLVGCVGASVLGFTAIESAIDPAMISGPVATLVASAIAGLGLRRAGWLGGRQRIRHLTWLSEGGWLLTDAAGRQYAARLRGETRAAGRWVWLSWSVDGRARCLLLAPGDIPAADLRRLAVRLRTGMSGRPARAISAT
jgi:hypothetical protein